MVGRMSRSQPGSATQSEREKSALHGNSPVCSSWNWVAVSVTHGLRTRRSDWIHRSCNRVQAFLADAMDILRTGALAAPRHLRREPRPGRSPGRGRPPGPGVVEGVEEGRTDSSILGTHVPLPKDLVWRSKAVQSAIERSNEILLAYSVSLRVDLESRALRSRRGKLKEFLPPLVYARWPAMRTIHRDGARRSNCCRLLRRCCSRRAPTSIRLRTAMALAAYLSARSGALRPGRPRSRPDSFG